MSLVYALLVLSAGATIAVAQKTVNVTPTFWFDSPQNVDGNALTVNLGDNVTIACNFTDKAWTVGIVRWHPNRNSVDDKTKMRKNMLILADKNFNDDFLAIMEQFPEFNNRLFNRYDLTTGTVLFSINNFQYEDAGDFGCYAYKSKNQTLFANLTINVTDTIVYADVEGNQQISVNLTDDVVPLTFNCSLYHVYGYEYENVVNDAYFDTCALFDSNGNRLSQPKCDGVVTSGEFVDIRNFTDPDRYGEYWPRTFERTKITTQISLNRNFYNRSVVCFARKNNDEIVSDFQALVQDGVDLHLDPANFRCTPHHVWADFDKYVTFSCVVTRPIYRQFRIFWEITAGKSVYTCESDSDCKNLNGVFIKNAFEEKDNNLYVKKVNATINVRATTNTGSYKYRLVAQYLNTKRFESDYFTLKVTGQPSAGAVQRPSSASHDYASPSLFLALVTFVLAFRV